MNKKELDTDWDNLSEGQKELIKEVVIARIKQMPDNFRISIG